MRCLPRTCFPVRTELRASAVEVLEGAALAAAEAVAAAEGGVGVQVGPREVPWVEKAV